ncbi:hypothetical protein MKW92_015426 [Papaver armeniacum]|nr:hypothetical protein MKW92_015426 [Papaver armeniacum]
MSGEGMNHLTNNQAGGRRKGSKNRRPGRKQHHGGSGGGFDGGGNNFAPPPAYRKNDKYSSMQHRNSMPPQSSSSSILRKPIEEHYVNCGNALEEIRGEELELSGSHVTETALKALAVHLQDNDMYAIIEETLTKICQHIWVWYHLICLNMTMALLVCFHLPGNSTEHHRHKILQLSELISVAV